MPARRAQLVPPNAGNDFVGSMGGGQSFPRRRESSSSASWLDSRRGGNDVCERSGNDAGGGNPARLPAAMSGCKSGLVLFVLTESQRHRAAHATNHRKTRPALAHSCKSPPKIRAPQRRNGTFAVQSRNDLTASVSLCLREKQLPIFVDSGNFAGCARKDRSANKCGHSEVTVLARCH